MQQKRRDLLDALSRGEITPDAVRTQIEEDFLALRREAHEQGLPPGRLEAWIERETSHDLADSEDAKEGPPNG